MSCQQGVVVWQWVMVLQGWEVGHGSVGKVNWQMGEKWLHMWCAQISGFGLGRHIICSFGSREWGHVSGEWVMFLVQRGMGLTQCWGALGGRSCIIAHLVH